MGFRALLLLGAVMLNLRGIWGGRGRSGDDDDYNPARCDKCQSTNSKVTDRSGGFDTRKCQSCGNEWLIPQ